MSPDTTPRKPIRLWPGVVAAALLVVVKFVVPSVVPGGGAIAVLGGLACGLAVLVWWLFFSRAPWVERVGAILVMAGALFATSRMVHASIANGMMGMLLPVFATPLMCIALVAAVAAGRRLSSGSRRGLIAAAILFACLTMTLVRTGGITGAGKSDLHWRWTETPEERLLARAGKESLAPLPSAPLAPATAPPATEAPDEPLPRGAGSATTSATPPPATGETRTDRAPAGSAKARTADPAEVADAGMMDAEWPGFRGSARDSVVRGVQIETDWSKSPPAGMWRRPIGPGWSSFAVRGDLVYTQEQRGEDEIVSCYRLSTGEPVWRHRDAVRFWESNAGAGPRATPSVANGRVYTLGATGVVNALDAASGAVVWSRNAATDTGAELPGWGFAGSPLVVGNPRHRRCLRRARGLRRRNGPTALVTCDQRERLQLAASGDARRRCSDPAVERRRGDERCAGRRSRALGALVAAGRRDLAAGPHGGR